jgi:hypothetical protein
MQTWNWIGFMELWGRKRQIHCQMYFLVWIKPQFTIKENGKFTSFLELNVPAMVLPIA